MKNTMVYGYLQLSKTGMKYIVGVYTNPLLEDFMKKLNRARINKLVIRDFLSDSLCEVNCKVYFRDPLCILSPVVYKRTKPLLAS